MNVVRMAFYLTARCGNALCVIPFSLTGEYCIIVELQTLGSLQPTGFLILQFLSSLNEFGILVASSHTLFILL